MFTITMPQAGNTMTDGTVVRWHKDEGQTVEPGEILLEVETDKATVEVESAHAGTLLKVLVDAGTTVPVHAPIALIGRPGEDTTAAVAAAQAKLADLRAGAELSAGEPVNDAAPQGQPPQTAPPQAELAGETARVESTASQPAEAASRAQPQPSAARPGGPVIPVLMPQVGNTMEEGTILKWRVQPGETVREGDILFEVETDKANIEVEAVDAGRLARILVGEGETVAIKTPVAFLADNDADVDAYLASQPAEAAAAAAEAPAAGAAAPAEAPAATAVAAPPVSRGGRAKASPAAKKLARERGIDLSLLGAGSGPGGRILSTDVPEAPPAAAPRRPAAAPGKTTRRAMSPMREAIARNLSASKRTIPHFYIKRTIDAGGLQDFYRLQKEKFPCTINDFLVAACAKAVQEFDLFRCRLDGEELVECPTANIGIAVGVPDGLVVPVLVNAAAFSLKNLAAETKRIVAAAREGKLEGVGQGVFTITNLGMFGIEEFSAIINPPEAAILAVGAIREEVVVRDGQMTPGRRMTLVLSCDHRIVDGMLAADFMNRLKELLEWPGQLV